MLEYLEMFVREHDSLVGTRKYTHETSVCAAGRKTCLAQHSLVLTPFIYFFLKVFSSLIQERDVNLLVIKSLNSHAL